jgi:predicted dehydrogenase
MRQVSRRGLLHGASATLFGATFAELTSACLHSGSASTASPSETTSAGAASTAGPATSLAASAEPDALPPDKRLGVALVGLGKLTLGELLPAFAHSKFARPAALVSGDRAKAERTAQQYGIDAKHIYDYTSFDRIRDDPAIDIVYVVLPNSMHAEYTIRAAGAGKHVLCEKPMATSVDDCRQMIAACEKAQKLLMIAYRLQYEPFHREVVRVVRAGELGKLRNFVTANGQQQKDPKEWRLKRAMSGGGALPDIGIYCLNAARYLSGEEPVEISALAYSTPGDPRFREVEEQIDFLLRFPSGFMASCASSYNAYESKGYRVLCEQGWLELDPAYSYRGLRLRSAKKVGQTQQISEPKPEEKNQFATEIDHFARCVLDKKKPRTPGEEGMQDMRIIEAIYKAADSGQVVKLPEVTGKDVYRGPEPG